MAGKMSDEIDTGHPERIAIALRRPSQGSEDYFVLDPTAPRKAQTEYVRADLYDALRARAEAAEAEVERLTEVYAQGCFVEFDDGSRYCVAGWAGGAAPGGAMSKLTVAYEKDGERWDRAFEAAGEWEPMPLQSIALRRPGEGGEEGE